MVLKFKPKSAHPGRAERLPVVFKVELIHADGTSVLLSTRNISDTGCFLAMDGGPRPELGSLVKVRLHGNLGGDEEPPLLTMKVMRVETMGIGLRFEDDN